MIETVAADSKAGNRERLDAATYKVPQAADRAQISPRTLWRLIDAKKVPGVLRIGRAVRISKTLFDAWLNGGGV